MTGKLPVRVRVTGAFTAVMAVVLAATGLFVYLGLRDVLTEGVDESLETRAAAVARLLTERGGAGAGLTEGLDDPGETFTQVIGPEERVVYSSIGLPARPLLDAEARLRAADAVTVTVEGIERGEDENDPEGVELEALEGVEDEPFEEERARVLARRVTVGGEELSVVVGVTLEDRDDTLGDLANTLLLGLPVALLLAVIAGYGAVTGSLRPVERMRQRAEVISAATPGERLPVPPTRDELGRLGQTLNTMLARLEDSFERQRAFVADASHELRTPLAILNTELELALREERTVEGLEAAVRSAQEEGGRLARIADDLLVLARSDRGQLDLRREPVEIGDLLETTRARFAARTQAAGRSIAVEAPPSLVLHADRLRLEQALANLIENALAHGAGAIEIETRASAEEVVFVVRDKGPGFPDAFLDRAFERFTRADAARRRGGAGLGLAIVALVAAAHGGTATVRNRDSGGAEALLRLPRTAPGEA